MNAYLPMPAQTRVDILSMWLERMVSDTNISSYLCCLILIVLLCLGEPKSRYTISVELKHKFIRSTIPISFTTNENGEVKLGQLSNITRIRIPKLRQDIQVKVDEQVNFWPTSIFESEGNNIRLPFFSGEDYILSLGKSGVDS